MEELENPAAKLLAVIETLKEQPAHLSVLEVIAKVFKLRPQDSVEISKGLLSLAELCRIAKLAMEKHIFGDKSLYLAPIIKFETFISSLNLTSQWSSYLPSLSETMITELRFADHFLQHSISNAVSGKSATATHLSTKLNELLEECLGADLDPKLKEIFVKHIQRLREALDHYRIYGEEALQQILDETVGSIHRHSNSINNQSSDGKDFITRLFDAIGKINDLVAAPGSVQAIATSSAYFLPLLG